MNAYFSINSHETDTINLEKYDVEVRFNKMKNWKNSGKYNLFRDEIEALKNDKWTSWRDPIQLRDRYTEVDNINLR